MLTLLTIALCFVGFVAGFLGSMFGLGGGFVMVPLMNILGVDIRIAVGTSAAAIFFNMLSSALAYSRYKFVLYKVGLLLAAPALITAYYGAQLTKVVDPDIIRIAFGFTLFFVGFRVFKSNNSRSKASLLSNGLNEFLKLNFRKSTTLTAGGALAGLLAGFLGVGGGVVNVPLLVSLNVPIHYAVATSSFTITFTSITSATTHYMLGNVDLHMLIALTPTLILGAQLGARTAKKTQPKTLRRLFTIVLWFIAIRMILKGLSFPIP